MPDIHFGEYDRKLYRTISDVNEEMWTIWTRNYPFSQGHAARPACWF